jgi:hypothetical protein
MIKRVSALATIVFVSISACATETASVTLRFEPDHYLLALQALVTIAISNNGADAIQLSGMLRVLSVAPDGTQSILQRSDGEDITPGRYLFAELDDPRLLVSPGNTETFYLRTGVTVPDSGVFWPTFLADHHFDVPGKYLLRTEILTSDPAISFLSDQVSLTIDAPQGRDAAVLAMVRASTDRGENADSNMARQILTSYADSGYAPYWVAEYHTIDETLREALYTNAINRTPESYATELKLTLLRRDEEKLMEEAIDHFDLATALSYREKAKVLADDLAKSRFPYASSAAAAALDILPTSTQLQTQYNDRVQKFSAPTGPVVPFVQCVDRGSGKDDPMITVFGYDSANTMGKYIAPGAANRLRPDAAVAVLPVYFGPGHIPRVGAPYPFVVVTRHDAAPSWTLDGGVATVATATPACETLQPVAAPVTPLFDCLSGNDGGNLTAEFGYINPNPIPLRIPNGPANVIVGKGNPPSVFLPGEHHNVFVIKGKKEDKKDTTPAWTLQGRTDTATPNAIQCAAGRGGEN